jgi:tetratricopeptide (TPR) repeat protein
MTAADRYYIKAKENYPYEIDQALDALEYGLSYDDSHAGLLALKGEICHRDLKQFNTARECFELALYHDAQFVDTYYNYIRLLCDIDEVEAAEKLVVRALSIKGIDKAKVWHLEALMYERQGMFTMAMGSLNNALQYCQDQELHTFYKDESKRIRKKNKPKKAPPAEVVTGIKAQKVEGLMG